MKKTSLLLVGAILLLSGCKYRTTKPDTNSAFNTTESVVEEPPVIKDSIDILMEGRAEQKFNSTIFSGLRFGDNRRKVEKVLMNKGRYKTEIPIQVPVGDNVEDVIIRDYDAVYDNDELVSLVLYANEAKLLDALGVLYTTKYGKTKNYLWHFSNCEIGIEMRTRPQHYYQKTNVITDPDFYYDTYRKNSSHYLTKEPNFIAITYISLERQQIMERRIYVRDSIERQRLQRETEIKKQQEKEQAERLRTEPANNI